MMVSGRPGLVVIDMQNDYCHPRGVYARNGLRCFGLDRVVPQIVKVVERCKAAGVPVVYLRMAWRIDASGAPIDAGLIVESSRPFLRTEGLRRGTWGAEVLAEMPAPDYDIEKTRYSGFHNTHLDALLRGLGVDTALLAGVITNMCVEATARDAFHRDFHFVVLSDCVSGFNSELDEASLKTLSIFGQVASSEELLRQFDAGEPLAAGADRPAAH
jgi:ureidoacrylate peracid hydrolase